MTITLGGWALPFAITLGVFAWALIPDRRQDAGLYGLDIGGFLELVAAILVSLLAWLLWALLA